MGKSRLIDEFVQHAGGRAQVLRGRCLHYGDGITFWPVAEALRQAAGILLEDQEEEAWAKLRSLVGDGHEDVALRIWSLLGSGQGVYSKDELLWGVRHVLETIARRLLVVIFDDIHWAERIFLDLIEYVVDTSDGVPLLIVCAARHELLDEYPDFLVGRRAARRVELHELSRSDTARILGNLIGDVRLPASLEDRIPLCCWRQPALRRANDLHADRFRRDPRA